MLIPCVNIILKASNGAGSVKTQPRYFAKAYQILWRNKLQDEGGLTIQELPEDTPDVVRYMHVDSVAQAERALVNFFAGASTMGDPANNASQQRARSLFDLAFPNGLRDEIQAALTEDAKRGAQAARKVQANADKAHPSFLNAFCSVDEALSLQRAGFATLDDIPDDLVDVCKAEGITPFKAAALIARKRAALEADLKNPVAAGAAAG